MKRLIVLVAVATALVTSVARADAGGVEDAQDTGDVMDLATASHAHGEAPRVLVHSLSTFDEWSNDEFIRAEILFWIPDGDRSPDRSLSIYRNRDDSLGGSIHKVTGGSDCGQVTGYCEFGEHVGYANIYRSDEKTLTAHIAGRALRKDLTSYRWKAFLHYPCDRSGQTPCSPPPPDTHPGRVKHEIRH